MGDHRANVKIEFDIYGEKYKMDAWINWSVGSSEVHEIDSRVIEFFRNSYLDARAKWEDANAEYDEERRLAEQERVERTALARLKEKYEHK
jgi:hypothetical protein